MRNEGGYSQIFFPDGRMRTTVDLNGTKVQLNGSMLEASTYTCFHCNKVVHVLPKADVNAVGMCRNCMKPICQECSNKPCAPWEKKMQAEEARAMALRSYEEAK